MKLQVEFMERSRIERRDSCTAVIEKLLESISSGSMGEVRNSLMELVDQMEISDSEWKQQLDFVAGSVTLGLGAGSGL